MKFGLQTVPKKGTRYYVPNQTKSSWFTPADGKAKDIHGQFTYGGVKQGSNFTGKDFLEAFGDTITILGTTDKLSIEK